MTSWLQDSTWMAAVLATWLPFISFLFIMVFTRSPLPLGWNLCRGSGGFPRRCRLSAGATLGC